MADFAHQDLSGARFDDVSLARAQFHDVDLTGARFRLIDLTGVVVRGSAIAGVDISGHLESLRVNGVEVAPLVEAELDRRYPERAAMRPSDPDGYRRAWAILERLWSGTLERARALPEDLLHQQVDGEWSFIETLRHLLFATDAWVGRALEGAPSPWHPLDLPSEEVEVAGWRADPEARPALAEVLALRAERRATVRRVLDELTEDALAGATVPVPEPGYPESASFAVSRCLRAVLNEEWEHRLFAERDLEVLERRPG